MNKTGVKVKAWKDDGTYIGNVDIAELKKGMLIKPCYFVEVTGEITEDDIDYLIPYKDSGKECMASPLLFE